MKLFPGLGVKRRVRACTLNSSWVDGRSQVRVGAGLVARIWRWLAAGLWGAMVVTVVAEERAGGDFGKDIQLAPFVVKGAPVAIDIHARTKGDRRYAEKFANDVVEVAYEAGGEVSGRGLVIAGAEREPHPIRVFRRFLEMQRDGQLDSSMASAADELAAQMKKVEEKMTVKDEEADDGEAPPAISFETFIPAVPLPLDGVAGKLYQVAWAERFDGARVEAKFRALTAADLASDEFSRYRWVFYLPPQSASGPVFKEIMNKVMKAEKMGFVQRATIRSALFLLSPAVNKAFEALRKGMLFRTILRAQKGANEGDVDQLTRVYIQHQMPDLKPGSFGERKQLLAALEKQRRANEEYAKDPFVKPERLAEWEAAAFADCEGEYGAEGANPTHVFKRDGDAFVWGDGNRKPQRYYPAGERLLVNEAGTATIRFQVNESGKVTRVEERWVRGRISLTRNPKVIGE